MRSPQAALQALRAEPCGARLLDAAGPGDGVHLVGGAVRDLLLGPRARASSTSSSRATRRGRCWRARRRRSADHERFGTARCAPALPSTSSAPAPSRYPRPGALPEVRPATLDEDLARRDFTVNAIAVRPRRRRCAAVDGARRGPRARRPARAARRSFADDPTRLWRVAPLRRAAAASPSSRTRAALAARGRPVDGQRRPPRRRAAPRAARARPGRPRCAPPRGLNPAACRTASTRGRAGWPRRSRCCPPARAAATCVVLAACVRGHGRARAAGAGWTTWASPPPSATWSPRRRAASTGAPLRAARTRAEIARAARGAPLEAVALAGGDNARRWIDELRHVRLEITGDDLLAAGRAARARRSARALRARAGPQARRRGRRAARQELARRAGIGWPADEHADATRCDGTARPGHYEVYYLSATDPASGIGAVDPLHDARARSTAPAECSLWFMAMDRRTACASARKVTLPVDRAERRRRPVPADASASASSPTAAWPAGSRTSLGAVAGSRACRRTSTSTRCCAARGSPRRARAAARRPARSRARCAFGGRELELDGARGGQAHLWGSKHAAAGRGCTATTSPALDGAPRPGLRRRRLGLRAALRARDRAEHAGRRALPRARTSRATGPLAVVRAPSRFGLTSWHFEARAGKRRIVGEVDAPRDVARRRHLPRPRRRRRPTATTARWPRCASSSSTARRAGARLDPARHAQSPTAARTSSTRQREHRAGRRPLLVDVIVACDRSAWAGEHLAIDLPGGRRCSPRAAAASPRARTRR